LTASWLAAPDAPPRTRAAAPAIRRSRGPAGGTWQLPIDSHEALSQAARREGDARPEVDATAAAAWLAGPALLSCVAGNVGLEPYATSEARREPGRSFPRSVGTRPIERMELASAPPRMGAGA